METISKVRAVGGSLMVRLPKDLVKVESIRDGELVKIKVEKIKKSLFGSCKGVGSLKGHERFSDFD